MYNTIDEVREANREAGFHFFEPTTMRFFSSRVHDRLYAGRFFVTSELNFDGTKRHYTVREALDGGQVGEVGGFQQYESRTGAHAAARRAGVSVKAEPIECESCRLRPAVGVLTIDGDKVHLCQRCVPNSPVFHFEVYPHLTGH